MNMVNFLNMWNDLNLLCCLVHMSYILHRSRLLLVILIRILTWWHLIRHSLSRLHLLWIPICRLHLLWHPLDRLLLICHLLRHIIHLLYRLSISSTILITIYLAIGRSLIIIIWRNILITMIDMSNNTLFLRSVIVIFI